MPVLCQLVDPDNYRVSEWNIAADAWTLDYWIGLFKRFPSYIEPLLRADPEQAGPDFDARWSAFEAEFITGLAEVRREAESRRRLMTIDLTRYRNKYLSQYGWPDPYRQVKTRENELAARLYPRVIERIDAALPGPQRWERLIRGLFAGNMFDLGSPETIEMYHRGEIDFHRFLDEVPARPWFVDDADALVDRLTPSGMPNQRLGAATSDVGSASASGVGSASCRSGYRQALIFVDNAGSDIVLGVLPVAREMARAGTRVVLAANDGPALNDITATELRPLLQELSDCDDELARLCAADRIAVVGSGGDTPLIDLGQVGDTCNAEAARSDLIVLEGMGRGIESNWDRAFKCDVWRVAVLKDEAVVRYHRAKLFDPVCRFDVADSSAD